MNYQALKQQYDRDGFVVVRQLLAKADFAELQQNLGRYLHEVVPTLPPSDAFYVDRARPETLKQLHRMDRDPFFTHYAQHPAWLELATALTGEQVLPQEPEWFNKPAGTQSPTPPHQDNYYFCLVPPNVTTLWMALDEIDDENGCLRYARGSHLAGVRPHVRSNVLGFSQTIEGYDPRQEEEVAIHLQPGDVLAHHGNTIHRAEANCSATRQRRALAIVYRGIRCQRDETAFERYSAALRSQQAALATSTATN